jgi:hypothetical protein
MIKHTEDDVFFNGTHSEKENSQDDFPTFAYFLKIVDTQYFFGQIAFKKV